MANTCPMCGAPLRGNYCEYCGYRASSGGAQQADFAYGRQSAGNWQGTQGKESWQSRSQQYSDPVRVRYEPALVSRHNRWAALALCFFLGCFGIHRFYVGKVWSGLIYLLTFGFGGLGAFVDLIRIAVGYFKDKEGYYLR